MPSIYVHNYFAKDLQKRLSKTNNKIIKNPKYLYVFTQSFDNLFYYKFFEFGKGKKYRKLGHYAHIHNVWEYFKNIITYIKDNKLYTDDTLGYLYGSLAHYALDSTAHPYIHYISGRYSKSNKKETNKYKGNHAINEIMLDAIYYYKDHNTRYYKYKLYNDIIPKMSFSQEIINILNYSFKKTFNVDNLGVIYNKGYNHSRVAYKYLMYDRFNIKKLLYRVVDIAYPFKKFKAYSYSHHIKNIDSDILNDNHNIWLHPVTGDSHNESFEELYEIAMNKVLSYIKICNEYFEGKCSIDDVEQIVGNISYSSGLDCDIRAKFQYFKY